MATLNIKNIPEARYARIRERANANHRSISQEVAHILTEVLEAREPASLPELQALGKEIWVETDAVRDVETERRSWD